MLTVSEQQAETSLSQHPNRLPIVAGSILVSRFFFFCFCVVFLPAVSICIKVEVWASLLCNLYAVLHYFENGRGEIEDKNGVYGWKLRLQIVCLMKERRRKVRTKEGLFLSFGMFWDGGYEGRWIYKLVNFFQKFEGYYIHSRPSSIDTSSHLTFN